MKSEMANARSSEVKALGSGRGGHSALDNGEFFGCNIFSPRLYILLAYIYIFMVLVICLPYTGSHKHTGRRGPMHNAKDADGSSIISEGKHSKRGGAPGYGSHEVLGFNLSPVKQCTLFPYFMYGYFF